MNPPCPHCNSSFAYQDQTLFICPECGHEWNPDTDEELLGEITDVNGTKLVVGDKVTVVKDLKVKSSSNKIKIGTKAIIRRINQGKDHQLDCKVEGNPDMFITAKFVKKA